MERITGSLELEATDGLLFLIEAQFVEFHGCLFMDIFLFSEKFYEKASQFNV